MKNYLAQFILILFTALHLHAQNFVPASTNTALGSPNSVVAADINGDGRLDLICPSFGANAVLVFTNKGGGAFANSVSYKVGGNPMWVATADINHDGKMDLISANTSDNTLTILTNNGIGIFGSNAVYSVGLNPHFVTAADIDGSGWPALITANYNASTLSVLTNNGFGIYGSNATYIVGLNPATIAVVDINGSGHPALIAGNYSADTLTIYTNTGSGKFGSNAVVNANTGLNGDVIYSVVPADIYGNGKLALLCANYYSHTLIILTNNGFGHYSSNSTLNTTLTTTWGAAADLNGDGKADAIAVLNYGDVVIVYTNNGSGILSSNASYAIGDYSLQAIAADLNNDGKIDIITASDFGLCLGVLTNATPFSTPGTPPLLAIKNSAKGAKISWPTVSPGWSLQQSPTVTAQTWLPSGYSGYPITDDATNKSLTLPSTNANTFFRLLHP